MVCIVTLNFAHIFVYFKYSYNENINAAKFLLRISLTNTRKWINNENQSNYVYLPLLFAAFLSPPIHCSIIPLSYVCCPITFLLQKTKHRHNKYIFHCLWAIYVKCGRRRIHCPHFLRWKKRKQSRAIWRRQSEWQMRSNKTPKT